METLHFRARVRDRGVDLLEPDLARRLWDALRRAFPLVLAVVLMPEHLHLLLLALDATLERRRLSRAVARATAGRGRGVWEPVERAAVVPDALHRKRSVRYILLNPCRRGLARDPAEWTWSTYRDVVGATVDPWVTPQALAPLMGWPTWGWLERFHEYVSSDPSVAVAGTPPPLPARACVLPEQRLDDLIAATASAMRVPPRAIRRRGSARNVFVGLAWRQGWRRSDVIALHCGVSPSTVRRIAARGPVDGVEAAALCLGDDRLRSSADALDQHALNARRTRIQFAGGDQPGLSARRMRIQ